MGTRDHSLNRSLLDELALVNRPDQFVLLEAAMNVFVASQAVTRLLVRGSLARGTTDRMSDVDFVIGVQDHCYPQFVTVLDDLVRAELGAIMPGWRDTIVSDSGGLGYVYLVAHDGGLRQLDLYLAPVSQLDTVHTSTLAHPVYIRGTSPEPAAPLAATTEFITRVKTRPRTCAELLIETLVVGYLIRKRIARGQGFIAYSESYLFNAAVKNLIKAALAPLSRYHGWYALHDEIGVTPIGKQCLADLDALISGPAIPTVEGLTANLDRVVAIAERATPETVSELRQALDAYWHYLELP